jgi:ABC-2 type transport system permease protein
MGAILALCLWSSLVAMIPETAAASLIGFLALAAAFALLISHVAKARFPGLLFFAAALGACLGLYIFKRELLSGLLNRFLQVFAISGGLSAFTSYYVFDVRAIILFLSVGALFVFLTVQSVRKRQWN